jgi:hypothetical protein
LKPTDREKAITQAKQAAYATLAEDAARAAAGSNLSEAVDAEVEALIIEGGKEVLKLEEVGDEWMKSSQIRLKDT